MEYHSIPEAETAAEEWRQADPGKVFEVRLIGPHGKAVQ
jgi:hypothetical protein